MNDKSENRQVFVCSCLDLEHVFSLSHWNDKDTGDGDLLYLDFHFSNYKGIFRRIRDGFKFLFFGSRGYSELLAFDSIILDLDSNDPDRLISILQEVKDDDKNTGENSVIVDNRIEKYILINDYIGYAYLKIELDKIKFDDGSIDYCELIFQPFIRTKGFFGRLKEATKYIFKRPGRFGTMDEFVVRYKEAQEIISLIKKAQEKYKEFKKPIANSPENNIVGTVEKPVLFFGPYNIENNTKETK